MTMTNEERRRASGAAMEASRRGSGAAMEASRRASGAAMTARRTGKSVADDIQSLVQPPRQAKPLPRIDPVGPLPAQRGTGNYQAPSGGGGSGGGIAGPLVETPGTRTYHESTVVISSTDGSTFMALKMPAVVTMTDANGVEIPFSYAANVNG